MHIVIIPARSGSKRIKNKNIKKFINEPIIAKTIKIVQKFNKFDKIYVSTNSNISPTKNEGVYNFLIDF